MDSGFSCGRRDLDPTSAEKPQLSLPRGLRLLRSLPKEIPQAQRPCPCARPAGCFVGLSPLTHLQMEDSGLEQLPKELVREVLARLSGARDLASGARPPPPLAGRLWAASRSLRSPLASFSHRWRAVSSSRWRVGASPPRRRQRPAAAGANPRLPPLRRRCRAALQWRAPPAG